MTRASAVHAASPGRGGRSSSCHSWSASGSSSIGRRRERICPSSKLDSLNTSVDDMMEERFAEELDFGSNDGAPKRKRGRPRKNP